MRLTDEEIDKLSVDCWNHRAIGAVGSHITDHIAATIRSALAADRLPHPQADVEARLAEIESEIPKLYGLAQDHVPWLLDLVRDQAAMLHDLREESSAYQWGYREGQEAEREQCIKDVQGRFIAGLNPTDPWNESLRQAIEYIRARVRSSTPQARLEMICSRWGGLLERLVDEPKSPDPSLPTP